MIGGAIAEDRPLREESLNRRRMRYLQAHGLIGRANYFTATSIFVCFLLQAGIILKTQIVFSVSYRHCTAVPKCFGDFLSARLRIPSALEASLL